MRIVKRASLPHAEHVACLALQLHDSLAEAGVIAASVDARELLFAAAMLHDLGMAIGDDDHEGHSHYLILGAGLPGFGPRELALIPQIVRYHRKGTPDLDDLRPCARRCDRELLQRCALLLRLAELLEIGEDQSVRAARLGRDGGSVRLRLEGDGHLALWNARRKIGDEAFRRVFGHRLVLPH